MNSNPPAGILPQTKMRLLCVEDDAYYRRLLRVALCMDGHVVESVSHGLFALELVASAPHRYDAVITDHHMPEITGLELAARLRSQLFHGRIYALTGFVTATLAEEYHRLGGTRIFDKTRQLPELRQVLLRLSEEFPAGPAVTAENR